MHQEPTQETLPPLLGMARLMRRCYAGENLLPLGQALLARALENPNDAHAYLDFSMVLQLTGNRAHGLAVQAEALKLQWLYALPTKSATPSLRLLVLMAPGDFMANTPVELLLEDTDVAVQLVYLLPQEEWPDQVPDHDVMMVAVGESDESQWLLQRLIRYTAHWPRPIINRPGDIVNLSRDMVCLLLQNILGVEIPVTLRITRTDLQAIASGERPISSFLRDGGFPIIVRPVDSHAGKNLVKLMSTSEIGPYLAQVPDQQFYLSRFVDYKGRDGLFRKYRIALVKGKPFISHLAVSDQWLVHYANAAMEENAEKRMEEMQCMMNFEDGFAARHGAALQAVYERMGLHYFGIDCAENQRGELLIFEVDNAMVVHSLDSETLFPYKKPTMEKIFHAFRQMLATAAQETTTCA